MKKIYLLLVTVILCVSGSFAQVVSVTNPTNTTPNLAATYTSLANAITALDAITAISGPVTITLNAGNPETAPAGGYIIQFTATTSAANTVTISGSNNTITASAALTAGRLYDGIFKIIGADYITIQNFTMQENPANTTTTAGTNNMTEWGVAMLHSSVTDGAQHNTIQNNTISLNRTYQNTFGIYSNGRHAATTVTTTENITNVTGSNFGNKVYGNNISNVGYGIVFVGSSTPAFMDDGNDIGGNAAATGNTITNWGEGATAISGYVSATTSSFCIYINHQINENVSYNTITSATVTGAAFTFGGILKAYSTASFSGGTITSTINNNTITLSSTNASGTMDGILNQNLTALSTATFNMNNNLIVNCSISAGVTSSAFGGIIHSSAPGVLNISNNIIRGLTSTSTTGGYTGISNSGAVVTTINITSNKLGDAVSGAATFSNAFANQVNWITNTGGAATATININNNSLDGMSIVTSGQTTFIQNQAASAVAVNINNNQLGSVTGNLITFSGIQASTEFFIYNGGATAAAAVSISGNDIRGVVHTQTATGQHQYIRSNAAGLTVTMSNNTFTNLSDNVSTNTYFLMDIPNKAAGASTIINNNSIVTGYNKTAAGGAVFFIECAGSSVNGSSASITNNSFSNVTVTGATAITAIAEWDGVSNVSGPTKTITGNTISNITGGSSDIFGIYPDYSAAVTCTGNTVSNISGSANIYGIVHDVNNGQGTFTYSTNTISSLSSSGGNVDGFYGNANSVPLLNMNSNTITGLSSGSASAIVNGVDLLTAGAVANIYDNTINSFTVSGTTAPAVNGINITGGTSVNVFRNKIHTLAASGNFTATGVIVEGIRITWGNTVTVYNNFVSNLTAPNISYTEVIRGIDINSISAPSNYNLYYNSVYLNAASTGTTFGTSGIYHTASALATTAALNMIDNIIVNTSTPAGTGVSAAFRVSSFTHINFAATSDYNLFYAGTPSATKPVYYDGSSWSTLAAYQGFVSPRETNSISLMPNFTSVTDLHLTTANCWLDGRGTPVAGITTDIDAAIRNVTTPDMGADEFTAVTGTTLAGIAGSATCESKTVSVTGTTYTTNACDLIAKVLPSGFIPVNGKINTCVTLDASQQAFNGEPYVQRHFDIDPVTNPTIATSTLTLYFTNAEFVAYNTNNPVYPKLPTSVLGNADPNRANVRITQFHGTATTSPSKPGFYTGPGYAYITPALANVFWNGTNWEVTFNNTGFSGFYLHTTVHNSPLAVSVNYFRGTRQGSNHLLDWKVTCNSTPTVTITLERSASSAGAFTAINTISATAARCNQPFSYTDAQPLAGMNYYRLKMVDADGKISYSGVVALLNAVKGFEIMNIAPNPVTSGNFKLNVASAQTTKLNIVISDMMGRIVSTQTISLISGYNSIDMNVSNLASGTYNIYGTTADDKSKVIRFVKQ